MLIFYRQESGPPAEAVEAANALDPESPGFADALKKLSLGGSITPIVLIDSLRSDDRFGTSEIATLAAATMPKKLSGRVLNKPEIYSVEYNATYSITGVNPGDSWRSRFFGLVFNPPGALISLFSPQYFVEQESMEALTAVVQRVVNPQKTIVYASMIVRGIKGVVGREFVAYAAQHSPSSLSTDTKLTISGAGFDDIIITAKKAVNIDQKTPLFKQLEKLLAPTPCTFAEGADKTALPVSKIFRPAMPLNEILGEICLQNQLSFIFKDGGYVFHDTRVKGAPPAPPVIEGGFTGSKPLMVYNFALSDYTLGQFSADVFDIKLFSSMTITNDIGSAVFTGLNKVASPAPAVSQTPLISDTGLNFNELASRLTKKPADVYKFFILAYDLIDGRDTKQLKITATNNWLISQAKVAALLENQVYTAALKK